jgi:hypothetical protein
MTLSRPISRSTGRGTTSSTRTKESSRILGLGLRSAWQDKRMRWQGGQEGEFKPQLKVESSEAGSLASSESKTTAIGDCGEPQGSDAAIVVAMAHGPW